MKKALTLLSIALLLATLSLTIIPQNVSSKTQDIKVLSYSYYIDNLGFLDVVGEIQNTGTSPIKEVVLTLMAYGADGAYQGNCTKRAWVSYMLPQQKAPFLLDIMNPTTPKDSTWYTVGVSKLDISVSVANDVTDQLYPDLAITVNSAGVSTNADDKGTYWINGVVRNTGSKTASQLAVAATFYNSSGSVVAVGHTDYLTPESLSPSGTVSFKVGAYDTNQTDESASRKITDYSLIVQAVSPSPTPWEGSTATPQATGSSPTDDPSNQNGSTDTSANQNTIYIIIIAGVVIAVIAALLLSRRRHPSKGPTVETKKPVNRKKRA